MTITVADDRLVAELARTSEPIEMRAPDGRILGMFTPIPARPPEPPISDDELRVLEDPTAGIWHTAAEVEAKLRELRRCGP